LLAHFSIFTRNHHHPQPNAGSKHKPMRTCSTLFLLLCSTLASLAQSTRIELLSAKPAGYDGDTKYFEVTFKVLAGRVEGDGKPIPLAIALPNKTKEFVYLISYESVEAGKSVPYPMQLNTLNYTPKAGQQLLSHELAPVAIPEKRSLQAKTGYAYLLDDDNKLLTVTLSNIKGHARLGDVIHYVNDRGQKGSATIKAIEIRGGYLSDCLFEGIIDDAATLKVLTNGIDISNATISPDAAAAASTAPNNPPATQPKHRMKTIPVEKTLENNEVKITIHQLVKFNPDSTARDFDIFKVDYSLDYYIVDATVENKTNQPLDAGEYLLRLNFFTPEGKSADDFLRVFRKDQKAGNSAQSDADKVDRMIFGGTSKIPLAQVMVKYIAAVPDYDSRHKAQTDALDKPLAARQKVRSINATIMGVPPAYGIEGLGTWSGVAFDKKKFLFVSFKP
jgi:hypothetical protein